jgi:chemotaxis protein CheD
MRIIVSVSEMRIGQKEDRLVTHALGSCLGLTVYDPVVQIGGLLQAMLPFSKINVPKAALNPFMFVDTGIPALFEALYQQGVLQENMVIKAVGCSNPMGEKEVFKIGERNYRVLQDVLVNDGICLAGEDVGGTDSRMVQLDVATGQTLISSNGTERVL